MTDLLCIMFSTCWRVPKCWILLLWVLFSNACTPQFAEFVPLQSVCCADVLLLWWMDRLWEYFWVFTVSFLRRIDPEVKFWVMSKTHIYQFPHISTNTSKKKYWSWKKMLVHLDLQLSDDQWCWISFLSSLANCFLFETCLFKVFTQLWTGLLTMLLLNCGGSLWECKWLGDWGGC